jgi:diadenosine tetraphosphate (Ap4A) HIT family hydrolase
VLPRTQKNPFPAPYGTHDPEWINHYPDALDKDHADAVSDVDPEPSSAPPPEMPPLPSKPDIAKSGNCIFCQIVSGKRPSYQVYRDAHCMAFLDIFPLTEGHTLIIPLEHHPRLTRIPLGLSQHIGGVVSRLANAVVGAVHGEEHDDLNGFNVLVNNGTVAGQVVG